VGEFDTYGNLDCRGPAGRFPHPELPFGLISALSVWKDRLFVVDVLNRRIVKCRISHAQEENNGNESPESTSCGLTIRISSLPEPPA